MRQNRFISGQRICIALHVTGSGPGCRNRFLQSSVQEITLFLNIFAPPSPHLPHQCSLICLGPPGLDVVIAIPHNSGYCKIQRKRENRDWDDAWDREDYVGSI